MLSVKASDKQTKNIVSKAKTSLFASHRSREQGDQSRLPAWTGMWGAGPHAVLFSPRSYPPPRIQPKLDIGQPDDPYEQEADRVAEQVMRMPDPATPSTSPAPRTESLQRKCACGGEAGPGGECAQCRAKRLAARQQVSDEGGLSPQFQREHFCLNDPVPSNPARKSFTSAEMRRVNFGLWAARGIASRAYMNLARRDPHHLRMAQRTFGAAATFDILDQHVARISTILNGLTPGQNLFGGTCDNPDCNSGHRNAVAVTLDDLSGIVVCPFFFLQPARTLATTFLHEAGHMANIDVHWAPGNERYCRGDDVIECNNICPLTGENLLENVDAWARFIYCVSMST